jgi:hypothetical protein
MHACAVNTKDKEDRLNNSIYNQTKQIRMLQTQRDGGEERLLVEMKKEKQHNTEQLRLLETAHCVNLDSIQTLHTNELQNLTIKHNDAMEDERKHHKEATDELETTHGARMRELLDTQEVHNAQLAHDMAVRQLFIFDHYYSLTIICDHYF